MMCTVECFFKYSSMTLASLLPALTTLILYHTHNTETRVGETIALTALFGLLLILFTNAQIKRNFWSYRSVSTIRIVSMPFANLLQNFAVQVIFHLCRRTNQIHMISSHDRSVPLDYPNCLSASFPRATALRRGRPAG